METSEELKPVAYSFELAELRTVDGDYTCFGKPQLSFEYPTVPDGAVRNLTPLYAHRIPTAADTGLVFPQGISKETQDALDAIDANIRNAHLRAHTILVGAADTGLVERLTGRARWYDDAHPGTVKTPQLLREAAAALEALQARIEWRDQSAAEHHHEMIRAEQQFITAQERIARLTEVCAPFAAVLDNFDPTDEDDETPATLVAGSVTDYSLTLGDFRRAAALKEVTDGQ